MANEGSKLKVVTIVGARPQFVKAAALSPQLKLTGGISELIVHTGQHFDHSMSDIFFEEMSIPAPHRNLGIGGGTHGQNTGRMIEGIEQILLEESPDAVLVYGDTDSTLAAAIATSKLGLPLAHVEAGLRSHRRAMPEEINRVLTDHVSDVLYAPSQSAVDNLGREGVSANKIVNAGDVMLDVVKRFITLAKERSSILEKLQLRAGAFQLMTLHRKENVDDRVALQRIFAGIEAADTDTVFLIHPRTSKRLNEFQIPVPSCVRMTDPVGYLDMLRLIEASRLVLTDSGGLQKEAYFLDRPCVTLREETEWNELVDAGVNVLTGSDPDLIAAALRTSNWTAASNGIYGSGHAARTIAEDLLARLSA